MTLPFTETAWRSLANMTQSKAVELGSGALAHVKHYVREIINHRALGTYIGEDGNTYSISVVNAPYLNISEVGHVLCTEHAQIGMGWFERRDGLIQFSLRSNGDIDVSKIATRFGGGGHKNAAGFQMTRDKGRAFIDRILGRIAFCGTDNG
jgi:oligoribonuclease NrnB/cAMP/cGMP phosphodiesterase (DHH superfamily)